MNPLPKPRGHALRAFGAVFGSPGLMLWAIILVLAAAPGSRLWALAELDAGLTLCRCLHRLPAAACLVRLRSGAG